MPLVFVIDDEVSVRESLERGWPRASACDRQRHTEMILCLNIEVLYDPENRCRRRLKRLRIVGESAVARRNQEGDTGGRS